MFLLDVTRCLILQSLTSGGLRSRETIIPVDAELEGALPKKTIPLARGTRLAVTMRYDLYNVAQDGIVHRLSCNVSR